MDMEQRKFWEDCDEIFRRIENVTRNRIENEDLRDRLEVESLKEAI